jgi:hypothetical protein
MALLIGFGAFGMHTMAARSQPELPMRSVTMIVGKDVRDEFFDQLKKFADTYAFAIRIAPTTSDGEHFLVQMWREDIKAIGNNSLDPAEEFDISFYQNGEQQVEIASVDQLVIGLKSFVSSVQGITVLK